MIQCPHCGTQMHEHTQFCPGCGTPRTFVQERLQRQSAETGLPYEQLLQQAREQDRQQQAHTWAHPPTASYQPPQKSNRVWWIVGIVAGVGLLLCVICAAIGLVVWQRTGISIGEGDAGAMVREHLLLGSRGQYGEQWETLHPAHQNLVPREQYVSCGRLNDLTQITILVEFNEETSVPELGQVRTRVVTYSAMRNGESIADAVRTVESNGDWRWVMDRTQLTVYQSGRCP